MSYQIPAYRRRVELDLPIVAAELLHEMLTRAVDHSEHLDHIERATLLAIGEVLADKIEQARA